LCFFGHQIQRYGIDARLAVGSSLARHIAHRHYRGETYILQLDLAHVRMIQGWDVHLISQLQQSKVAAVLAAHVSGVHDNFDFDYSSCIVNKGKALLCNTQFVPDPQQRRHVRQETQSERTPSKHNQPAFHSSMAAGMSFAFGYYVMNLPSIFANDI
jgi:hypothetical protein